MHKAVPIEIRICGVLIGEEYVVGLADQLRRLQIFVPEHQALDLGLAAGIDPQPEANPNGARWNDDLLVPIRRDEGMVDLMLLRIQKENGQLKVQPRRDLEVALQPLANAQFV